MSTKHTKKFIITTTVEKKDDLKKEVKDFINNPDICVDKLSTSVKNMGNGLVKMVITVSYHNKIEISEEGANRLITSIIRDELFEVASKINI